MLPISIDAKGKLLFQTKTRFTCHQVDPAIPARQA